MPDCGADRVVADHEPRSLQGNPGQLCSGGMQGLHRQVNTGRNDASLEGAIPADQSSVMAVPLSTMIKGPE